MNMHWLRDRRARRDLAEEAESAAEIAWLHDEMAYVERSNPAASGRVHTTFIEEGTVEGTSDDVERHGEQITSGSAWLE